MQSDRAETAGWRVFWNVAIGAFLGSLVFDLVKAVVQELAK